MGDVNSVVLNAKNTRNQTNKPTNNQSAVNSKCAQSRCDMYLIYYY
jgi:hypothetical protein